MTTSFINRIILIAVLTFSFAANGMAKEPSLMDYNGIEYFTWNIDDNGTLHITPLADVTPDFQESPFIKYRKQITSIVFEEDFYNETTLEKGEIHQGHFGWNGALPRLKSRGKAYRRI